MESQFGKYDVPLYTGRLTGLRSFAITKEGDLTGVTYAGRWRDGENEAKCGVTDTSFYDWDKDTDRKFAPAPEGHHVAAQNCSCGYYGYFDGNDNQFQYGVNVEAVIEAWGKVTLGEKGFRASKGRIVALAIPIDAYPSTWVGKAAHRFSCSASWKKSHGWSYPYLAQEHGCDLPLFPEPTLMTTIMKRYPSAKIFTTIEDAIKAFPLTAVEVAKEIVGVK